MAVMKKEFTRLLENKITDALKTKGCVSIEGPKHSGKTFLAEKLSKTKFLMKESYKKYLNIKSKERKIFDGDKPHLIDEWQIAPQIWDEVVFRINQSDNPFGLYILTGSTKVDSSEIKHYKTVKILTMQINTLTFAEIFSQENKISLKNLFFNQKNVDPNIRSQFSFDESIQQLINGGWPEPLAYDFRPENEIISQKNSLLKISDDKDWAESIFKTLAQLNGTEMTEKSFKRRFNGELKSRVKNELEKYLKYLEKEFLIFNLKQWPTPLNPASSKQITSKTKKYWSDPSIPLNLLKIKNKQKFFISEEDKKYLGFCFESQVVKDLGVYANVLDGEIYYYSCNLLQNCNICNNTKKCEIDAIMELDDGKWAAFEIKTSEENEIINEAAEKLIRYTNNIVKNTGMKEPEFLMIITPHPDSYRLENGVFVVSHTILKI